MASFITNLSTSSLLLGTLITLLSVSDAANFNIRNNFPYTVWADASPGGGSRIERGQVWSLDVPAGTAAARIWPRTGCNFDAAGNGRCQTGDCGGVLNCRGYGQAPNTLAEYALNQYMNLDFIDISNIDGFNVPFNQYMNLDFIDISNVDGFNVPMEFASSSPGCGRVIRRTADIVGQCPGPLRVPGGCNGPARFSRSRSTVAPPGTAGPPRTPDILRRGVRTLTGTLRTTRPTPSLVPAEPTIGLSFAHN